MAKDNGKALQKTDASTDLLTINTPQEAPEGFEKSTRSGQFVGYFRGKTGDVLMGILRGAAPEAVIAKSKSPNGVALVELTGQCVVSMNGKALEESGQEMKGWVPDGTNTNNDPMFSRVAQPGDLVAVSVREGIKDEMALAEGTEIWIKVGKSRQIKSSGHTMYDYDKFTKGAKVAAKTEGEHIPFDVPN